MYKIFVVVLAALDKQNPEVQMGWDDERRASKECEQECALLYSCGMCQKMARDDAGGKALLLRVLPCR